MGGAGDTCVAQGSDPRLGTCMCQGTSYMPISPCAPPRALLKGPLRLAHATEV